MAKKKEVAKKKVVKKTAVAKGVKLKRGKAEKLQEKPGASATGRYKTVPKGEFAGKAERQLLADETSRSR